MRRLWFLLIMLATALPVVGEDWTTADGKTYKNVTVIAQEDDGVRITYTGGVGKIPYYELSLDLQKQFGEDYDSLEVKRKAAEKAFAEATRRATEAAQQKKQQDEAAAAQARTQPGANPQPVVQPASHPQPGANTPGVAQHGANPQALQPSVNPSVQAEEKELKDLYPGSKFRYNENLDVCYLDSPAVDVFLVSPEAAPATEANSPGQGTLTLRITTEGRKPEMPDQIEATFFPTDPVKKLAGKPSFKFLVDGTFIPVNEIENNDDNSSSGAGQVAGSVAFYLSPEQARSIFRGENINFRVGSDNYKIDPTGISTFRKYFDDVDRLPPASANFIRSYHRFLARLPSIITMISTVCEYIILGSFGILAAASLAAFALGVNRFMKM